MDEKLLLDSEIACKDDYKINKTDLLNETTIKDNTATISFDYARPDTRTSIDNMVEEGMPGPSDMEEIDTPFENDEPCHIGRFDERYEENYLDFLGTGRIAKGEYVELEPEKLVSDMYETDYENTELSEKDYFSLDEDDESIHEKRYSSTKEDTEEEAAIAHAEDENEPEPEEEKESDETEDTEEAEEEEKSEDKEEEFEQKLDD